MYLVAGLGITGESVLNYFQQQNEPCLAFDTRAEFDLSALTTKFNEVEFALGEVPTAWFGRFSTVVLSPGISQHEPWVLELKKLGKQIIGDIELFARAVGAPVIAITGSNGKSTVTSLTGLALQEAGYKVAVGGNIGEPVLNLLMDHIEYDVFVLELSSFQLETTYSLSSASSTILNISEDHMDRYLGLEDYISAKTRVFSGTDLAVIPAGLSERGLIHQEALVHFTLSEQVINPENDYHLLKQHGKQYLARGGEVLVPVDKIKLQGNHHLMNALAMMALCQPFNVKAEHFETVLSSFSGLPHRTELVVLHEGVSWINDSKGTNVGATVTALESLGEQTPGKLILIAGGVGKDADFQELVKPVKQYCKDVVLFGQDKQKIADDIHLAALQPNSVENSAVDGALQIHMVDDLPTAVGLALEKSQPQDCVLFSPACASFDQFKNYIERGEVFARLVNKACSIERN